MVELERLSSMEVVAAIDSKTAEDKGINHINLVVDFRHCNLFPLLAQYKLHISNCSDPFWCQSPSCPSHSQSPTTVNTFKVWIVGNPVKFGNSMLVILTAGTPCSIVMPQSLWEQSLCSVVSNGDTLATSKAYQHAWHFSNYLLHLCILPIWASPVWTAGGIRFDRPCYVVYHFFQLNVQSVLLQAPYVIILPILQRFSVQLWPSQPPLPSWYWSEKSHFLLSDSFLLSLDPTDQKSPSIHSQSYPNTLLKYPVCLGTHVVHMLSFWFILPYKWNSKYIANFNWHLICQDYIFPLTINPPFFFLIVPILWTISQIPLGRVLAQVNIRSCLDSMA